MSILTAGNLISLINIAFQVYFVLLFVRVLLSWVRIVNPYGKFYRFIFELTEPVLAPFRRIFKPSPSFPVDFSPILAFFALGLLHRLLIYLIITFL